MKKEKEAQLDFGLKDNPKNIYYKYKDQYELWLAGLETNRYFKDPLMWFTLILSSTLIFTQGYLLTKKKIPTRISVFNYYVPLQKRLGNSYLIYLYPLLGLSVLLIGLFISRKYYHKERLLSKVLLISILLSNFSLCIISLRLLLSF
ncbi:hypothetical protein GX888_00775 [Candidatus Dojkabacteria bacterium]|uniref:Uncharacterized protein n=1 Tax=Candidatus Dojkabacteria bacterium TaxID=2099670 RepID=A0A847VCR7_9BACT|nr:hypothetical protein [Candidatus Dojkabacteria bacterium]